MKIRIKLEKDKMTERETRDSIDRAADKARRLEQQKGNGDVSYEKVRERMQKEAEKDHRRGKI